MTPRPDDEHAALERAVAAAAAEARAGRWLEALTRYGEIARARFERFTSAPTGVPRLTAADAIVIERLADVAVLTGHPAPATKLFQALAVTLRQAQNGYAADLVVLKVLHLAISADDRPGIETALESLSGTIGHFDQIAFDDAGLAEFERACRWPRIEAAERALFFAQFFLEAGRLFAWIGQYGDARGALCRCVHHAGAVESEAFHGVAAAARLELAAAAFACGDLPEGRAHLDAASAAPGQRHVGREVRQRELAAQAALLAGDFGPAEEALTAARALCAQHQLAAAAASASLNLVHLLVLVNRTVEAESLLGEAEAVAAAHADPALAARAHRLAGFVAARRRSGYAGVPVAPSNAELWGMDDPVELDVAVGEMVFELGEAGGANLFDRLADYSLGFYHLLERNQLADAAGWLSQMNEVFGSSDSPLIALRLRSLAAMLAYYSRNHRAAVTSLDYLRGEYRRLGLCHDWWQTNCFRLWCYGRLGDDGAARAELLEETQSLLATMGAGLAPEARTLFELNKWSEEEAHLAARIDALAAAGEAARRHPWWRRWLAQWRMARDLDGLITALDDRRSALIRPAEPTPRLAWWRRVLWHSRRTLTLSFVVLPDRVFVAREGFLRLDFIVAPITRLRVRELVRGWHEAVAAGPEHTPDALRCAAELSAQLDFAALLNAVRKLRELHIVPDDALHGFPFAALRHAGCYLAEEVAVSCDTSHIPPPTAPRQPSARTALVAAMSLPCNGLPPLPGVLREAASVSRRFAANGLEVTCLLDMTATHDAFANQLSQARIAHVACHGVFARDDLRRTGLVLAPSPRGALVSLMDLAELPLGGVDHITLASCWSADNYVLPGRHLISLPQILRRAGAGTVLASLWPVDDSTAEAFHERFYDECFRHSPVEALRLTQHAFIRGKTHLAGQTAGDPFHWAGFTLYGAIR